MVGKLWHVFSFVAESDSARACKRLSARTKGVLLRRDIDNNRSILYSLGSRIPENLPLWFLRYNPFLILEKQSHHKALCCTIPKLCKKIFLLFCWVGTSESIPFYYRYEHRNRFHLLKVAWTPNSWGVHCIRGLETKYFLWRRVHWHWSASFVPVSLTVKLCRARKLNYSAVLSALHIHLL